MNFTANTFTSATTNGGYTYVYVVQRPPEDPCAGALAVLGVPPDMPPDGVRKAYRQALMGAHPDHGGTTEETQRIVKAYTLLKSRGRAD